MLLLGVDFVGERRCIEPGGNVDRVGVGIGVLWRIIWQL